MEFVLPAVKRTGEVAQLEVTTRESGRVPATVNVRFALPPRTLTAEVGGEVVVLPRNPEHGAGLPVVQFPVVMN